jgi:quercetin dioxygenase-like cupin family protein
MTREEIAALLKDEGFLHVYEWKDAPNAVYPNHSHKGKVSFYVLNGDIAVTLGGIERVINAGDRLDIPPGTEHSAKVGANGCEFLIGEEIQGDS